MGSCGSVIQGGEDTGRSFALDKLTDDGVVEVFNRRPLDLLSNVFLLFGFESQFDKDLLEFFVDVVDTELFKAVVL